MQHIRTAFAEWLFRRLKRRAPDVVIGRDDPDGAYMNRWFIIPRNPLFNIYAHEFLRDDHGPELHDHPWWNLSWVLGTGYFEIVPRFPELFPYVRDVKSVWRAPGTMTIRRANRAHRIELTMDARGRPIRAWTLFITGPRIRDWGFYCRRGWTRWDTSWKVGTHHDICG